MEEHTNKLLEITALQETYINKLELANKTYKIQLLLSIVTNLAMMALLIIK